MLAKNSKSMKMLERIGSANGNRARPATPKGDQFSAISLKIKKTVVTRKARGIPDHSRRVRSHEGPASDPESRAQTWPSLRFADGITAGLRMLVRSPGASSPLRHYAQAFDALASSPCADKAEISPGVLAQA